MISLLNRTAFTAHYSVKAKVGLTRAILADEIKKILTGKDRTDRTTAYKNLFDTQLSIIPDGKKEYVKSLIYMASLLEGATPDELAEAYERREV